MVQRIPVALTIEKPANALPLRAGMTATVNIDTQRKRRLPPWLSNMAHAQDMPPIVRSVLRLAFAIDASPDTSAAHSTALDIIPAAVQSNDHITATEPSSLSALATSLASHGSNPPPTPTVIVQQRTAPVAQARSADATIANRGTHADEWLMAQHADHYTVQVGSSADLEFLNRFSRSLPRDRAIVT